MIFPEKNKTGNLLGRRLMNVKYKELNKKCSRFTLILQNDLKQRPQKLKP